MIVLRSIGGLGNQMFEYAFARNLELKNNEKLQIDIGAYKKYKIRDYELDKLNVKYEKFDAGFKYKFIRLTQVLYHCIHRGIKIIRRTPFLGKTVYKLLVELGFIYNFDFCYYATPKIKRNNNYVYGYFQSEKYFIENKDIICSELKVKGEIPKDQKELLYSIANCNSIGISIRVGEDYSNDKLIYVCTPEYFYSSMKKINQMVENPVYYIFSDLPAIVKQKFRFPFPVKYVEGYNAVDSLRLLYTCKHFVISNSSFSWWGSYLADNKNKIVISPDHFSTNKKQDDKDIFFDNMIKNSDGVNAYE